MTPQHHPDADELVQYASGTAPEYTALVVACHLTFCAECRAEVALLEELGGALLDGAAGDEQAPPMPDLDRVPAPPPPRPHPVPGADGIPRPLHAYFKDGPRFRFLVPGVEHVPLSFSVGGIPARIVRFSAGFTVPEHRHEGTEQVLVLDGVLEDGVTRERFTNGDISRREAGTIHTQHIPKDAGPCTCLVVSDAEIIPSSMWGRLLKALTGV